jgi:hypothetical protein
MDRIQIPEHLDPSSNISDTASETPLAKKHQIRRKQVKGNAPMSPEDTIDVEDNPHQLDELA